MIVNAGYRGKVGASVPKFTYTGTYNVREDGVVELLTSGTLVFLNPSVIDRFMVGGGGAGGFYAGTYPSTGGGGGGGYTRTDKKLTVGTEAINITIGAGGSSDAGVSSQWPGRPTTWGSDSVDGGSGAQSAATSNASKGANGGSGGGGGTLSNSDGGTGGSDGGNGEQGGNSGASGGTGQGITTREFGEPTGKLYAGGGGGGRYMVSSNPVVSSGGTGGGGSGAWGRSSTQYQMAAAGVANTGGGGGGGVRWGNQNIAWGASGGSGIICFRAAK